MLAYVNRASMHYARGERSPAASWRPEPTGAPIPPQEDGRVGEDRTGAGKGWGWGRYGGGQIKPWRGAKMVKKASVISYPSS